VDLLDFSEVSLYFDEPIEEKVNQLINEASENYGETDVEPLLLEAYNLAPTHLSVLVAVYRYYYYQHRLDDALVIAEQALAVSGERLRFPSDWQNVTNDHLGAGALVSMGMLRFYLLALKAAGFLNLRLKRWEDAIKMLMKVVGLDQSDRLGCAALLDIANRAYQVETGELATM